ncbi:MAG: hypothetical protein ABIT83_24575 [Massilia sp.]
MADKAGTATSAQIYQIKLQFDIPVTFSRYRVVQCELIKAESPQGALRHIYLLKKGHRQVHCRVIACMMNRL